MLKDLGSLAWAKSVRLVLLFAIAALASMALSNRPSTSSPSKNPFHLPFAEAAHTAAAPGFISLTIQNPGNRKLCLIDKDKQRICVYSVKGDKLRLVSARAFNHDTDILDASLNVKSPTGGILSPIEGGSGVDSKTAAEYAEGLKIWEKEAAKGKKQP